MESTTLAGSSGKGRVRGREGEGQVGESERETGEERGAGGETDEEADVFVTVTESGGSNRVVAFFFELDFV